MDDELPDAVELPGLVLLDDEEVVSSAPDWTSVPLPELGGYELLLLDGRGMSELDEPEFIVPGELIVPEELESERELAPEPAPGPMLPEVVSRGAVDDEPEPEPEDEDDGERLLLDCELDLSVSRELLFDHFENSDCDSEPSLLTSAVVNAPLNSLCSAASVCEMRPSRFASSDENVAVPDALPLLVALLDPILLLAWPEVLLPRLVLPWLELLPWP